MWEIMVPTMLNDGTPIRKKRHQEWDAQVRKVVGGGLTVCAVSIGQWLNPKEDGKLYRERMIPVRIIADDDEIMIVIAITKEFYQQKAILCTEISNRVLLLDEDEIPSSKILKERLKRKRAK